MRSFMGYSDQFFQALGISQGRNGNLASVAKKFDIPVARLKYYNEKNIVPSGHDLNKIESVTGITELHLRLQMGRLDKDLIAAIQQHSTELLPILSNYKPTVESSLDSCNLEFETDLGKLYRGDCYSLLQAMESDSIDLIFADPPFNLAKLYPSEIDDNLKEEKYLNWCQEWIRECTRVLKPGGAFFIWNLPKWNASLTEFLGSMLTFRNWIGVDIKFSLPIQNRLYPSHYSLLYYIKGEKPKAFHPDRLAMEVCPKCLGDLKDYGGYKNKMNPRGVNISDIWTDIPPVRHAKYKRRKGANELSLKLLDRIIEMASDEGDLVFDPFGGSGTTYMAAELKGRHWIGCEIGPSDVIQQRFDLIDEERKILEGYRSQVNVLFPEKIKRLREKKGLWTCESIRKAKEEPQAQIKLFAAQG